MPTSSSKPNVPPRRTTLDAQLLTYWEREARRLEALAAGASWGWVARRYARKAERARAQAARSAAREAARDRSHETVLPEAANEDTAPTA
ncbi:hypothetical protein [Methylobacterium sp. J-090]|uniref:hypothetical protein n=1 Tax=Methylobacterium sp. J-090 TaxID=2836666 RepID=UPI001FB8B7C5|nr:hypothetical protein [Methylobacterium sp. J-090]MCJ2083198.1 hypothetical protein [Methylobacterium sp. J-090]